MYFNTGDSATDANLFTMSRLAETRQICASAEAFLEWLRTLIEIRKLLPENVRCHFTSWYHLGSAPQSYKPERIIAEWTELANELQEQLRRVQRTTV